MFSRDFSATLQQRLSQFPVVVLTGARQVGKTTLLRELLQRDYKYVLLEDPDLRSLAASDPRTFLSRYPAPAIYDEFQNVPELLSYLQGVVDSNRTKSGQFVLTGSQNFTMMNQVSQSLAGRAAVLSLYGLSVNELQKPAGFWTEEHSLGAAILRGFYPELWQKPNLEPHVWFGSYLQTYLERDVRNLSQVGDLNAFERFVRLCAIRTGQVLNLNDLARDSAVSAPTAKQWLSILIKTYVVHLVEPFYENLSSRVRKAPKLYFLDVGLAAYLMGFRNLQALLGAPQIGALFETLVIGEFLRKTANAGEIPEHCYLDIKSSFEIDLLVKRESRWRAFEIKYNRTITAKHTQQLIKLKNRFGSDRIDALHLLAPIETNNGVSGVTIEPWHQCDW